MGKATRTPDITRSPKPKSSQRAMMEGAKDLSGVPKRGDHAMLEPTTPGRGNRARGVLGS